MKIGKYNITMSNIYSYIQGNIRLIIDKYGSDFLMLPKHTQEQIIFRESIANPACIKDGVCLCNCSVPELFYADKTCENECYPKMMSYNDWENFKETLEHIDNKSYPLIKFWKMDANNRVKEYSSDLGTVTRGTIIVKDIELISDNNATIDSYNVSCGCMNTSITQDDGIYKMTLTIDTSKKRANHEFTVVATVDWSDNKTSTIAFNGYNKVDL